MFVFQNRYLIIRISLLIKAKKDWSLKKDTTKLYNLCLNILRRDLMKNNDIFGHFCLLSKIKRKKI